MLYLFLFVGHICLKHCTFPWHCPPVPQSSLKEKEEDVEKEEEGVKLLFLVLSFGGRVGATLLLKRDLCLGGKDSALLRTFK